MNTKISYLYRDADNCKVHNACIIAGAITDEQKAAIISCLDEGEYFIPSMVGMPEERFEKYSPRVDHPWFELTEAGFELVENEPTLKMTIDTLVQGFLDHKDDWAAI